MNDTTSGVELVAAKLFTVLPSFTTSHNNIVSLSFKELVVPDDQKREIIEKFKLRINLIDQLTGIPNFWYPTALF